MFAVSVCSKAESNAQRIGIFGGTFDPIHEGHIVVLREAVRALLLDTVFVMPANIPSFKRKQNIATGNDRLRMVELALSDAKLEDAHCTFIASGLEIERHGVTYTVDTVEALRAQLPANAQIYFILGTDAARMLNIWHRSADLANLCTFAIVDRQDEHLSQAQLEFLEREGFNIEQIHVDTPDISSTKIRELAARDLPLEGLVSPSVAAYIQTNNLYKKECE